MEIPFQTVWMLVYVFMLVSKNGIWNETNENWMWTKGILFYIAHVLSGSLFMVEISHDKHNILVNRKTNDYWRNKRCSIIYKHFFSI